MIDRIIMATAAFLGCPLATKDRRIRGIRGVATVW
jgi:PIN domain nuclease of toxin-antitoxin system